MLIGMNVIWQSVPIHLASTHQIGAMTVLSAIVYTLHCCRRVDPRHVKNLLGKLKSVDRKGYEQVMGQLEKQRALSTKEASMMKGQFESQMKAPAR